MILLVPTIIMAVSSSFFSSLGLLTVLHSSIPAVAIIASLLLSDVFIGKRSYLEKLVVLTLILAPFYITTSLHAWNFTFFDVKPGEANATIEEGFGKGIRTNDAFKNLYDWIRVTSDSYTKKDDYILSYVMSPMVHMIAKRRPALDDPFIDFATSPHDYYYVIKAIAFMKARRREPKLAFVFEAQPGLISIPSRGVVEYAWFGDQFHFPSSDPLSLYVMQNMTPVGSFKLQDRVIARCFIDDSSALDILKKEYEQDLTNPELNTQLGIIYEKRGDLNQATLYYKKAIAKSPKFIQALNQLAAVYKKQGNSEASLDTYKEIITIEPGHIESYYNIACIYSGKNRAEESIRWLKKAIEKGFDNWKLLQTDGDLNNIRGTAYYKEVIRNVSTSHRF
jgi:tetratricopeptide (TPR) repeat protein